MNKREITSQWLWTLYTTRLQEDKETLRWVLSSEALAEIKRLFPLRWPPDLQPLEEVERPSTRTTELTLFGMPIRVDDDAVDIYFERRPAPKYKDGQAYIDVEGQVFRYYGADFGGKGFIPVYYRDRYTTPHFPVKPVEIGKPVE